jgi:hypothetical protein
MRRIFKVLALLTAFIMAGCGSPIVTSSSADISSGDTPKSSSSSLTSASSTPSSTSESSVSVPSSTEMGSSSSEKTHYAVGWNPGGSGTGTLFFSDTNPLAGTLIKVVVNLGDHSILTSLTSPDVTLATADAGKTYTFTMPEKNVTLTAVFDLLPSHMVRFVSVPHVSFFLVSPTAAPFYTNETVTFTAKTDALYTLKEVKETNGLVTFANPSANTYSFVMPDSDVNITASAEHVPTIPQLVLSYRASACTVTMSYHNLTSGTEGSITASTILTCALNDVFHITVKASSNHTLFSADETGVSESAVFSKTALAQYEGEITVSEVTATLECVVRGSSATGVFDNEYHVNVHSMASSDHPVVTYTLNGGADGSGSGTADEIGFSFDAATYDVVTFALPDDGHTYDFGGTIEPTRVDSKTYTFTMPNQNVDFIVTD